MTRLFLNNALVPELDAVDELFYRVIHGKSAADLATPSAIEAARRIVREARAGQSYEDWKAFPTLGMMQWTIAMDRDGEVLCLATDDTGSLGAWQE